MTSIGRAGGPSYRPLLNKKPDPEPEEPIEEKDRPAPERQESSPEEQRIYETLVKSNVEIQSFQELPPRVEDFLGAVQAYIEDDELDGDASFLEDLCGLDHEDIDELLSFETAMDARFSELSTPNSSMSQKFSAVKRSLHGLSYLDKLFEGSLSDFGIEGESNQDRLSEVFGLRQSAQSFSLLDVLPGTVKQDMVGLFLTLGLDSKNPTDEAFCQRIKSYVVSGLDMPPPEDQFSGGTLHDLKKNRAMKTRGIRLAAQSLIDMNWERSAKFMSSALSDFSKLDVDRLVALDSFSEITSEASNQGRGLLFPVFEKLVDALPEGEEKSSKSLALSLSRVKQTLAKGFKSVRGLDNIQFDSHTLKGVRKMYEESGNSSALKQIDLLLSQVVILDHYQQSFSAGDYQFNGEIPAALTQKIQDALSEIGVSESIGSLSKSYQMGFQSLADLTKAATQLCSFSETFKFDPALYTLVSSETEIPLPERLSDFSALSRAVLLGNGEETLAQVCSTHTDKSSRIGVAVRDEFLKEKETKNPFKKLTHYVKRQKLVKAYKRSEFKPQSVAAVRLSCCELLKNPLNSHHLDQIEEMAQAPASGVLGRVKGAFTSAFASSLREAGSQPSKKEKQALFQLIRTDLESKGVSVGHLTRVIKAQVDDLFEHGGMEGTVKSWHSDLVQADAFSESGSPASTLLFDQVLTQVVDSLSEESGIQRMDLSSGFHAYGKVPPSISALIAAQTGGVNLSADVGADKSGHLVVEKSDSKGYEVTISNAMWAKLGLQVGLFDDVLSIAGSVSGEVANGFFFSFKEADVLKDFLKSLLDQAHKTTQDGIALLQTSDTASHRSKVTGTAEVTVGVGLDLFDGFDFKSDAITSEHDLSNDSVLGLSSDAVEGGVGEDGVGVTAFGVSFEAEVGISGRFESETTGNSHEKTKRRKKVVTLNASASFGMLSQMLEKGLDKVSDLTEQDFSGGTAIEIAYETETATTKTVLGETHFEWRKGVHMNLGALNVMAQPMVGQATGARLPLGMASLLPEPLSDIQSNSPETYDALLELAQTSDQGSHFKAVYALPDTVEAEYNILINPSSITREMVKDSTPKAVFKARKKQAEALLKHRRVVAIEAYKFEELSSRHGLERDNLELYRYENTALDCRIGRVTF